MYMYPSSSAESDEIPKSADEEDTSTSAAGTDGEVCVVSALDCKGVAVGCFVLARCLQLGQAVARNEQRPTNTTPRPPGSTNRWLQNSTTNSLMVSYNSSPP